MKFSRIITLILRQHAHCLQSGSLIKYYINGDGSSKSLCQIVCKLAKEAVQQQDSKEREREREEGLSAVALNRPP